MNTTEEIAVKFRNLFVGKSAKRCRACKSPRFHVPPHGGIQCSECSPGESILDLIASGNPPKLTWQEFDPEFDGPGIERERREAEVERAASDPDNPAYWAHLMPENQQEDGQQIEATSPPPPQRLVTASGPPKPDGRICRLLRDQTMFGGKFPAGREFKINYTFDDTYGIPHASLASLSGGNGISCIPIDRLEIVK